MRRFLGFATVAMATPPPRPFDDGSVLDPLECPPLKWGILGCGRVSHDFCRAVQQHVTTATMVACATANDAARARDFAKLHSIPSWYDNYDDLLNDPAVDIVYVGNVHVFRREIGEKCLLANKHVLLEKPFACGKVEDAEYLIQLAAERNLFLQEGMWTRFFPAVELARQIVCHDQLLGDVVCVMSDFHFNASDSEVYPDSFFYQRKLGGGASLLVASYPIAAALLFFNGRAPDKIQVSGQVDAATGVDLQAVINLQFSPTSLTQSDDTPKLPGAGLATLTYGMLGESEEVTTVVGTKGRLTIHSPCHCPTRLTVTLKGQGRGNAAQTLRYDFPLPEGLVQDYFYPNSAGLCYEAAAVARCIACAAGTASSCPQFTLAETLIVQQILQETRHQLSVKSVDEV